MFDQEQVRRWSRGRSSSATSSSSTACATVHGAWCWYKLVGLLRSAGHAATAVDLAASGAHPQLLDEVASFAVYARPLMELMASLPARERVVLVGHSAGGVCVALAMEAFPEKVCAAVFATGLMPSPSCSVNDIADQFFKGHPLEAYMDSTVVVSGDPPDVSSVCFGREYMATRLYQLSPPEDLEMAVARVRPASCFLHDVDDHVRLTEGRHGAVRRRVFVVCKEDKSLSEEFQRWMIKRSRPAEVREIEGADHMVMLSRPSELLKLLLEIVDEEEEDDDDEQCRPRTMESVN